MHRIGASADLQSVIPPKISEATKKQSMKLADETMKTTMHDTETAKQMLRQQIHDGVFVGDATAELGKRVNDIFTNLEKSHALMIGQTEASRAVHEGLRIAARESGVVKGFQFLTSAEACPICQDLSGKTIGLDEQFTPSDYDDSM
jgi:hypothetical protein